MADLHFLRPWWLVGIVVTLLLMTAAHRNKTRQSGWYRVIAPELADALIRHHHARFLLSSINIWGVITIIGFVALAGPTWHKQLPEGQQDKSTVMVLLANGPSMYTSDVPPNRNRAAKAKITALRQQMPQSAFGVIVWSATAHLVIPPTHNDHFFELFLPAIEPDIMPASSRAGSGLRQALSLAQETLQHTDTSTNLLIISDQLSETDNAALRDFYQRFPAIEVLVAGTAQGGNWRFAPGDVSATSGNQVPIAAFDTLKLAGLPVISLTEDNQDLHWVMRHIQSNTVQAQNANPRWQWSDSGFWLVLLMLPLAFLLYRHITTLTVLLPFLLLATSMWAPDARADWQHVWWTGDQIGQRAMMQKDYHSAALNFTDSYRKGRAWYLAKNYEEAAAAFRQVDSAEGLFYLANSLAQQQQYQGALYYYQQALRRNPQLTAARINAAIVQTMLEKRKKQGGEKEKSDDNTNYNARVTDVQQPKNNNDPVRGAKKMNENELNNWMADVDTSPKEMLKSLFLLQAQGKTQ
ncbi:VWA domain-containing protein [Klebsiella sp. R390]|uniref:VWA domain-containing protein n=1 Tax=Klebsiella sp. R390 TaxID=2755400 RepID=UPI003DA842DD